MSTNAAPATIEIYAQAERRISQLLMKLPRASCFLVRQAPFGL
jgi:hypothetical protein